MWDYFDIRASRPPSTVLADRTMPGARWFVGAQLNIAENFFARANEEQTAIIYKAEDRPVATVGWAEIRAKTAALAQALRAMGVQTGDRVVAYLPNIPEAIIAFCATASLGAIWSSCSPDFGSHSVLDRFQQIEPKVLLAVDGYRYHGKLYNRVQAIAELQVGLPTLTKTIVIPSIKFRRLREIRVSAKENATEACGATKLHRLIKILGGIKENEGTISFHL